MHLTCRLYSTEIFQIHAPLSTLQAFITLYYPVPAYRWSPFGLQGDRVSPSSWEQFNVTFNYFDTSLINLNLPKTSQSSSPSSKSGREGRKALVKSHLHNFPPEIFLQWNCKPCWVKPDFKAVQNPPKGLEKFPASVCQLPTGCCTSPDVQFCGRTCHCKQFTTALSTAAQGYGTQSGMWTAVG